MLVCTFNQEKALVGGFSVIVKSSRIFVWSSRGDAVWGSCDTNHTTFYKHSTDHPRKCPSWPDICCAAAIIVVYWASRRQWCWCLGPAPATLPSHITPTCSGHNHCLPGNQKMLKIILSSWQNAEESIVLIHALPTVDIYPRMSRRSSLCPKSGWL